MPITRAKADTFVVTPLIPWLAFVELSVAVDGTNTVAGIALATSMRLFGFSVADFVTPTDADLANVPNASVGGVLAGMQRELLRSILTAFTAVDEKEGVDQQSWNQFGKRVQDQLDELEKLLTTQYGLGRRRTKSVGAQMTLPKWPPTPPPPMAGCRQWPPQTANDERPASGRFNP